MCNYCRSSRIIRCGGCVINTSSSSNSTTNSNWDQEFCDFVNENVFQKLHEILGPGSNYSNPLSYSNTTNYSNTLNFPEQNPKHLRQTYNSKPYVSQVKSQRSFHS
jgi:hypothetical protein